MGYCRASLHVSIPPDPSNPTVRYDCPAIRTRSALQRSILKSILDVQDHSFASAKDLELGLHLRRLGAGLAFDALQFLIVMSRLMMEQNQLFDGTLLGKIQDVGDR